MCVSEQPCVCVCDLNVYFLWPRHKMYSLSQYEMTSALLQWTERTSSSVEKTTATATSSWFLMLQNGLLRPLKNNNSSKNYDNFLLALLYYSYYGKILGHNQMSTDTFVKHTQTHMYRYISWQIRFRFIHPFTHTH